MTREPGLSSRLGLALMGAIFSQACDSCRRDHPFTPFVVTSNTSTATAPEAPPPAPSGSVEAFATTGEKLPPNTRQFSLGSRQAEAPESMVVDSVIRADWNEDGKVDGVSLMRATQDDARAIGAIYFHDGAGDARKLLDLPGWMPSSRDCSWDSHLTRVSPRAAVVDVTVLCNAAMPPRTPNRWLAVVSPMRSQPLMMGWRLAEPASGETYSASPGLADLDGDKTDDVTLRLELGLASGKQSVHAEFAWLDRAAGLAKEPGHLGESLAATLTALEKKSMIRSTALEAFSGAGLVWRLLGSSCGESATPRLFGNDGTPLVCEGIAATIARLASIEVHSALSQNDVLRAAYALSKFQDAFGTSIPSSEYTRLVKLIRKASITRDSLAATATDLRPQTPRANIHYSPLLFQSDGTLLVMTRRGVLRVHRDGHEIPQDEDAGAPAAWSLSVTSSDGRTLENLVPSCDRSEIVLLSKGSKSTALESIVTHELAPRPGLCGGATSLPWHQSPIRFDAGRAPLVLLEGACLDADGANPCLKPKQLGTALPGSPVSPDGQWLVAVTKLGVFVIGGLKPELWEGNALGNPDMLRDCVIADGGDRIACDRGGRVWLYTRASVDAGG